MKKLFLVSTVAFVVVFLLFAGRGVLYGKMPEDLSSARPLCEARNIPRDKVPECVERVSAAMRRWNNQ